MNLKDLRFDEVRKAVCEQGLLTKEKFVPILYKDKSGTTHNLGDALVFYDTHYNREIEVGLRFKDKLDFDFKIKLMYDHQVDGLFEVGHVFLYMIE